MPIWVILSGVGARTWVYSPACLALVELVHLPLGVVFHDLLPRNHTAPLVGWYTPVMHVEGRGLARAVGADQGDDLPLVYLQIHVVHRDDAAELHGDILQTKDLLTHFAASFFFDFPARGGPAMAPGPHQRAPCPP